MSDISMLSLRKTSGLLLMIVISVDFQKSPAKELGHTLRKSFRCIPAADGHRIPQFPETPEKTLDLSFIV